MTNETLKALFSVLHLIHSENVGIMAMLMERDCDDPQIQALNDEFDAAIRAAFNMKEQEE